VLVKTRHHVGTAVYSWRGLVLTQACDPITTESAYIMLVDYTGRSIHVTIVVCCRCQETLEVCHQIEFEGMLFIVTLKFQFVFVGRVIFYLLCCMLKTVRNVGDQHLLRCKDVQTAIANIACIMGFRATAKQTRKMFDVHVVVNLGVWVVYKKQVHMIFPVTLFAKILNAEILIDITLTLISGLFFSNLLI